jgi:hypothetical protein
VGGGSGIEPLSWWGRVHGTRDSSKIAKINKLR